MKLTLIYATEPEWVPLKFVRDPTDAQGEIQQRVATHEMRANGAQDRIAEKGGQASMLGLLRWRSAKWIEIDFPCADVPVRRFEELRLPTP